MRKEFILLVFICSLFSCDKIDNPLPTVYGDFNWNLYPNDPSTYPYNLTDPGSNWSTNTNPKGVLLEDYTGHKCTNCPAAAVIAKQLEDDTSLNVIVASIHASTDGSFQSTDPVEFTEDYKTDAGDAYVQEMIGFIGNPMGTINRNDGGYSNTVWYFSSNWATGINDEISSSNLEANLQLQYNYYPSTNGLFIHTETSFLNNLSGNYHLIIYLVRDEVVSPQKMSDGSIDHHYHHHAILSDNINGTWGTLINDSALVSGDVFYHDFSYELPNPSADSTYNIDNLSLITYVCDRSSFKVLQTIRTELSN